MVSGLRAAVVSALLAAWAAPLTAAQDLALSDGPRASAQNAPESFSVLAKRLMPAVVNISTSQTIVTDVPSFPDGSPLERFNEFFGRDDDGFRREGSLGSGFVISSEGLIVTNNHVIESADQIDVTFSNGTTLRAELIGRDSETDLAVLKVESADPLPFVAFADSDQAEVGDWVIAIGNPFGFGGSVSAGIISALDRDIQSGAYDDFIQTDAAINRGNSGGPLFTLDGEVVGVNTAIISPTGGSIGIGFSIPANLASSVVAQLVEFGQARRGWLGVNVQGVDASIAAAYGASGDSGVIITRLDEGGPAQDAGLEVGDLLLTFDSQVIDDVRALTRIVAETEIGKTVSLELIRGRRERTIEVVLGERENPDAEEDGGDDLPDLALADNALGVEFAAITDSDRRRYGIARDIEGALVKSVSPQGLAAGKLQKGDVVVEMGFETVDGPRAALEAISAAESTPSTPLLLRVKRNAGGASVDVFYSIDLEATS
ncbi:MAG: Do family serine endopeptidase [Pseudomonadota bacterium]